MANSKSALLFDWWGGNAKRRLVAQARATPGYEDSYVLEELQTDAMGDAKWVETHRWSNTPTDSLEMLLTSAIKKLIELQAGL